MNIIVQIKSGTGENIPQQRDMPITDCEGSLSLYKEIFWAQSTFLCDYTGVKKVYICDCLSQQQIGPKSGIGVGKLLPAACDPHQLLQMNIVWNTVMPTHFHIIYGCFHGTMESYVVATETSWPALQRRPSGSLSEKVADVCSRTLPTT